MTSRQIHRTYSDPLDLLWIEAARRIGMTIRRSHEVNASWDGDRILTIGSSPTLDPDDTLAQMILHEACHALCEGPSSWSKPDWGLSSYGVSKRVHEHACLRLQAKLVDTHSMRRFFASTTIFRSYYDDLPSDPLADDLNSDPAVAIARNAYVRPESKPWIAVMDDAIRRTAIIARALSEYTSEESLWHR